MTLPRLCAANAFNYSDQPDIKKFVLVVYFVLRSDLVIYYESLIFLDERFNCC